MADKQAAWFTWGDELLDSGFIAVPNGLMKHQRELDLSPQEINVILQVASYFRESGQMFPTVSTIAKAIGVTPRQVRRINESLVNKGYLKLGERWAEGHRRTSNTWNFSGLISKLRSLMSQRGDKNDIPPPVVDVSIPPDKDDRVSKPSKEHTEEEVKIAHKLSRNPNIAEMQKFLGFPEPNYPRRFKSDKDPIPNPAKEAGFIGKMKKRGFSWEEIFGLWKEKVVSRNGEFVSMQWVNEDIGKKGGKHGARGRDIKEAGAEKLKQSVGPALD